VHASVPYTHGQYVLKALFKFGIFTLMLKETDAKETDAYAQQTHQFLTRMLRVRISH
jgi:hypothetical protein